MRIKKLILLVGLMVIVFAKTSNAQQKKDDVGLNDRISTSINQGLVFLADTSYVLDFGSYAIMTYLNRLSALQLAFDFESAMRRVNRTYEGKELEYKYFNRLVAESEIGPTWEEVNQLDSRVDSTTLQALWSDQLKPSKKRYYAWLMELSKEGGFELTHALLAIKWLEETGYSDPKNDKEFASLKRQVVAELKSKILTNVGFWGDVEIEAVAFLLYIGEYEAVKAEWIQQILAAQRPDGGWAVDRERELSVAHPTSLAVWALLSYSLGPSEQEQWIRVKQK